MTKIDKWDERFMRQAFEWASYSKDPSTKVGAVVIRPETRIVVATGYNGPPRGIADDARLSDRDWKIKATAHAEVNAIYSAARYGHSVEGCVLYCTWPSCAQCAVAIIQAGITAVVRPDVTLPERWRDIMATADELLHEAGVLITNIPVTVKRPGNDVTNIAVGSGAVVTSHVSTDAGTAQWVPGPGNWMGD